MNLDQWAQGPPWAQKIDELTADQRKLIIGFYAGVNEDSAAGSLPDWFVKESATDPESLAPEEESNLPRLIPLERIFAVIDENVAHKGETYASCVIETRYIDPDWRSVHSAFYSTTFERFPSVAHRLHFFAGPLPADLDDLGEIGGNYLGYTVLRPLSTNPVGRTMIAPPPALSEGFCATVKETVDLLGTPLTVRAVPFISQDGQYFLCAHADIWMVLRHSVFLRGGELRTPADVDDVLSERSRLRDTEPSSGLSASQIAVGLSKLGHRSTEQAYKPKDNDLLRHDLCRAINSGCLPIVLGQGSEATNHTWVISGYTRKVNQAGSDIVFYRHDDAEGPYLPTNAFQEPSKFRWAWVVTAMPSKFFMSADQAEEIGKWWVRTYLRGDSPGLATVEALITTSVDGRPVDGAGELTFRAYAVRGRDFKHSLRSRGVYAALARAYRSLMLPRNLWVIEVIRRSSLNNGSEVIGEVIVDPTAHHEPGRLHTGIVATHMAGDFSFRNLDGAGSQRFKLDEFQPYPSGCPVDPNYLGTPTDPVVQYEP